MQLQKEVKSNPKQPSCKSVRPPIVKKDVKSKKWLDGRLMAKNLNTTLQVNLVPNPSETWRRQHKFTCIVVIKILAISLSSSHFLAATLDFFTMAFLTLFYSWAVLD